jgi:hypothetical protein
MPSERWKESYQPGELSIRINSKAELRREDDSVARNLAKEAGDKLLILVGTVDLRRV